MTQLLTSVKNVDEAMIASYAGINLIDLKDPATGALGALTVETIAAIVDRLSKERKPTVMLSATVGEGHASLEALIADIETYSQLGLDIIKIAVTNLFLEERFFDEIEVLTNHGVRLVAVFFAEEDVNLGLIAQMAKVGFYGVMLDTQYKQRSLLAVKSAAELSTFVTHGKKNQLVTGLAGSINAQHIATLTQYQPDFIGMRGGLCEGDSRTEKLCDDRLHHAKKMLFKYNICREASNASR